MRSVRYRMTRRAIDQRTMVMSIVLALRSVPAQRVAITGWTAASSHELCRWVMLINEPKTHSGSHYQRATKRPAHPLRIEGLRATPNKRQVLTAWRDPYSRTRAHFSISSFTSRRHSFSHALSATSLGLAAASKICKNGQLETSDRFMRNLHPKPS